MNYTHHGEGRWISEFALSDGVIFDTNTDKPLKLESLAALVRKVLERDPTNSVVLVIEFDSRSWYVKATHLDPPEYGDERNLVRAFLDLGNGQDLILPPWMQMEAFVFFEDEINACELLR